MSTLVMSSAPDFPETAYGKACECLDAFGRLTSEYRQLLDTQLAMLRNDNSEGIVYHTSRGDAITREIDGYGQQLRATRDAMIAGGYAGPMTDTLTRRFAVLEQQAADIATATARLAAHCAVRRDAAAAQLDAQVAPPPTAGLSIYRSFDRTSTFDVAI